MASERPATRTSRPWFGVLVVIALIAVAAVLITSTHASFDGFGAGGARGIVGSARALPSGPGGFHCVVAPNFSSDGSRIAVLAVSGRCSSSGAAPFGSHVAAIYDARTGSLLRAVPLDTMLEVASVASAPPSDDDLVSYYSLGFSPDDAYLAFVYTSFASATRATPDTLQDEGLLLVDLTYGSVRIIRGDNGYFSAPGSGLPVWDLAHGAALSAAEPQPGLAFAWGDDGRPYPIIRADGPFTQLPVSASARYPVGDPASGSTFTLWQPGLLLGPNSSGTGQSAFISTFPTWSAADAFAGVISLGATLPTPSHLNTASNSTMGYPAAVPDGQVTVPARDPALASVQREIGTDGWALVAWNREGSLLASVNCVSQGDEMLEVRSTTTGEIVGSAPLRLPRSDMGCSALSSGTTSGAYPDVSYTLRWSPDGSSLLYGDVAADTLTQWPINHLTN